MIGHPPRPFSLQQLLICVSAIAFAFSSGSVICEANPSDSVRRVLQRLDAQSDRYDKDLAEFVQFPSVSALPEHAGDVLAAAEWLSERLKTAGLQNVELLATEGLQPVVYGEWLNATDSHAPTVLVYGHYDVQPVDPLDAWDTPPFEVVKRDGYFYGRGVDDDKGGLLQAVQAVEAWLQETGAVPVNVKFLLEGQEEIMSPHLNSFLHRHAARLAARLALSADGGQPAPDQGGISLGLRGVVSLQVDVVTADTDLHSGMKGGSSPNPNQVLAELLAGLHDPTTRAVADVEPITDLDRMDMEMYGFDPEKEARELGLLAHVGEEGYSILEQRWHRPTLEVVGMTGGFTGAGIKTVIPRTAMAKISCRLVPNQAPGRVLEKILKLDTTKFGWGLSERIHAPNERLRTDMYDKGRRAWAMLLEELPRHVVFPEPGGEPAGEAAEAGKGRVEEAGKEKAGADVSGGGEDLRNREWTVVLPGWTPPPTARKLGGCQWRWPAVCGGVYSRERKGGTAGGWQRLRPDFCSQLTQSTRVQIRLPAPRVFEE
ncbi:hypothetical protein VOLCADRAFT_106556 [Volvox carteri f. nagariensis]|uniref:Peptidase M20 dimerisation domain-containing protein n=1 Tax=Volvox carteri f. nagariensis TaxID=3068 RepID=D8U858_VOLCA|nr:uncharacterized protein VOLCADRAFT_106556 [Volvox carteri f. nagariensis]EFJ44084.1 hypothetical protein VOLCADRAFT_106556 [Volvox carteri f. nagariensis]|eukprot:XP_002954885.1 hypothetical protein VOLCADRAFT_106556 [Volvox carteri f. nagariensis]